MHSPAGRRASWAAWKGFELVAASMKSFTPINTWSSREGARRLPYCRYIDPGEVVELEAWLYVPSTACRWALMLDADASTLLRLDGEAYAGLDEHHRYVLLGPGRHKVRLELEPAGGLGRIISPVCVRLAGLVGIDWALFSLGVRVIGLASLVQVLGDSEAAQRLSILLSRVLGGLRIAPSPIQLSLAYLLLDKRVLGWLSPSTRLLLESLASRYGERALRDNRLYQSLATLYTTPSGLREEVMEAWERLEEGLRELKRLYPEPGRLYVAGHSHIDAAWLWSYAEAKRRVIRTFSSMASLLEAFEGPVFVQGSAQYYEWLERVEPSLFDRVKELVREGRWVIVGGMWVESDTNIVDGEALARQFLYGQRYFLERFGRIARIGWLPDSFGFAGSLPQLLAKSGIRVFVTHKPVWNDTNRFPYSFFKWIGIDGSEVLVHILATSYEGDGSPADIYRHWSLYGERLEAPVYIYTYGYGDGGGGPASEMIELLRAADEAPALPRLIHLSEDSYIGDAYSYAEKAPTWRGEIYLETHRGVYTSNLVVKNLVAEAENRLREAEAWNTIARLKGHGVGQAVLDSLWKRLLLHEFHDVVSGTAIREAYEEAYRDLKEVIAEAERIIDSSLESIIGSGEGIAVANPLPWPRKGVVRVPEDTPVPVDPAIGEPVECQDAGSTRLLLVEAPPLGYRVYRASRGSRCRAASGVALEKRGGGIVLGNEEVVLVISPEGYIESIRLRGLEDGELLSKPSNKLIAHVDDPGDWDAWNLDPGFLEEGEELELVEGPRPSLEGALGSCVETRRRYGSSEAVQEICLYKGSPVIHVRTRLYWREKNTLLKAWFYPRIRYSSVFFDAPYGVVERSASRNTSWERARFETPALRWIDVSDGELGLAIVAPSRHGYSVDESRISLSLVKSPILPNPWSDLGVMETTYYVIPHRGGYDEAGIPLLVEELVHGLHVLRAGNPGVEESFLETSRGLVLGALKRPVDEGEALVLRVYNPSPRRMRGWIRLPRPPRRVVETDILELEELGSLPSSGHRVVVELGPYEVKTVKILF